MIRKTLRAAAVWAGMAAFLLAASPGQEGPEKMPLRFSPAAGTRLDYNVHGMVTVGGKNLLGRDLSLTAVSQGELRFAVQTSTRDTVRARLTSPGIEINVQTADRTLTETLRTEAGKALEIVFNRSGKVEEIRNAEALSQQRISNFSIPQILTDYFPVFPAEPVGPGDVWMESRRITVPFQGFELLVQLKIDYALNDIFPSPDGRKATISAVYSVTVSGSQESGDSVVTVEGGGTGSGFLNFLVDKGVFTEYRIDFKTDAAFVARRGDERLLDWPFSFSVFADVSLAGPPGF
jgi:hypothetical protein